MTLGGMRVGGVFRMFGGQHNNVAGAAAGEIVGPRPAGGSQDRTDARQRRGPAGRAADRRAARADVRLRAARRGPQRRGQDVRGDRQAGRRGPEPALRAGPRAAAEPAVGAGRDAPPGRARPATLQVSHRDPGPAAAHPLSRDHPPERPEPRPAQEAERRSRPVRRRQDRDPAAPARRGLRVRRQDRRRLGAAAVHPGGRGGRARVPAARPARLPGGRRQRHAVRRPVPQRRQLGDRVQDGDGARAARRPAQLRADAAWSRSSRSRSRCRPSTPRARSSW